MIYFSKLLFEKYGIFSVSVHPGIINSNITRNFIDKNYNFIHKVIDFIKGYIFLNTF